MNILLLSTSCIISQRRRHFQSAAFSLIEVVVAIGIFSFIIVGIIGLFPILLENQKLTVFDNRGVLITQHPLSRMQNATNLASVFLNRGYDKSNETAFVIKHLFWEGNASRPLVLGIQADGTSVGAVLKESDWENASISPDDPTGASSIENITIKAKIGLRKTGISPSLPGLYRFDCEVSQPANLPLAARMKSSFSTLVFLPD